MDLDKLKEIFDDDDSKGKWSGDNAIQGLAIIAKYFNPQQSTILCGADHDVIYSVDAEEICEKGLTEEDAKELNRLNWMLEDGEYLACFV